MDPTLLSKTAHSTPASSPGLYTPLTISTKRQYPPLPSDETPQSSPYLHPLQMHKVRETHKAQVEQDFITGRKLINQYEIIDEIGRGVHGKVKLARSLETGDHVAIKIIQRFSKKRRLGRVTVSPEDKTKREIAILKKIRHPNVVGLLEIIDDPELKKIYMVLEHVELGEIVWRKKGVPRICLYERRRVDKAQRGETDTGEDEKFFRIQERRRQRKESQRAKTTQLQLAHGHSDFWSLEHGEEDEASEGAPLSRQGTHTSDFNLHRSSSHRSALYSNPGSLNASRATSRAPSRTSSRAHTPLPEHDIPAIDSDNEEDEPGPLPSIGSAHGSASALEGTYYGSYTEEPHAFRGRSPSMADSIISHMSSIDDVDHDPFEEDYSYVPCFTIEQARSAFRDTVLGLEYLHYQGIVHRDIKPANLLWTKDHRVKISDFGVSYFGRPIREGEMEENISEADATDFDDDLELAKTVGTPAFFAPELCYTDLDMEQPKITEQIDVWSLGITLYCLIYARIPFLADDEYQLFRCIAKNEVFIPRRRLKAVDPAMCNPATHSTNVGPSTGPFREEGELAFEDIDDELHDLLRRMLIKDPAERIKLRDIKRHPWVLDGVDNILGWIDDTDPSRKTAGRRIQVDRTELDHAVVPITFLERARSAVKNVKKVVGKVMSATRSETGSRRRAVSNATSSGTESFHTPVTPIMRETLSRRSSLRGDEPSYFTAVGEAVVHRETMEHPLSQSLTASPDLSSNSNSFLVDATRPSASVGTTPKRTNSGTESDLGGRPGPPDRTVSAAASIQTVVHRGHSLTRTMTGGTDESPITPGPFTDHQGNIFGGHLWNGARGRDVMAGIDERGTRQTSSDRGLFSSEDKHAGPTVAMSNAIAPGHFEQPVLNPRHSRSTDPGYGYGSDQPLPSPLFFLPSTPQHHKSSSTEALDVFRTVTADYDLDERPATATRIAEVKPPSSRVVSKSIPAAQEVVEQSHKKEDEATPKSAVQTLPDDEIPASKQDEACQSQPTTSSASAGASQHTSTSEMTSPVSASNTSSQEQLVFPSVPSLPALVSSGSSVCADPEGDFLQEPGVVAPLQTVLSTESTTASLTPPLSKESSEAEDTPTALIDHETGPILEQEVISVNDHEDDGYVGDRDAPADEDSDSDSDGGLMMGRKKATPKSTPMARRGTNASVGSTETAKKVDMNT